MSNNFNRIKFLNYLSKEISKEGIIVFYESHNIKFDKCEIYKDFVQSLLMLVFDTYMGDSVTNSEDQTKHFNWCWDKNLDNFSSEGFNFKSETLHQYFLEFTKEVFYETPNKDTINNNKKLLKLWLDLLDYNGKKTYSDMDSFLEIYNIFEKSLKNT